MKRNILKIAKLLETNGVGFVKIFFRSNIDIQTLSNPDKWNNKNDWILFFSNGKENLGSINLLKSTIWRVPPNAYSEKNVTLEISLEKMKKNNIKCGGISNLKIVLKFNIFEYDNYSGTCFITDSDFLKKDRI